MREDMHFAWFSRWDGFFSSLVTESRPSRVLYTSRHANHAKYTLIYWAKFKIMKTMWYGFISQLFWTWGIVGSMWEWRRVYWDRPDTWIIPRIMPSREPGAYLDNLEYNALEGARVDHPVRISYENLPQRHLVYKAVLRVMHLQHVSMTTGRHLLKRWKQTKTIWKQTGQKTKIISKIWHFLHQVSEEADEKQ